MRIKIAGKLRPFSHQPGIRCLIPFSTWEAQIFPTKIFFKDLAKDGSKEVEIPKQGPIKGFTVLQDLERGRIEVLGRAKDGYFRYFLDTFIEKVELPISLKRLSLGYHKKQDWELIQRRAEMGEIFPYWIRLAQLIPELPLPKEPLGTMKLLDQLDLLFQAGFQGILVPRLTDEYYLGLIPDEKIPAGISPLGILHEGARRIERLFFYEEDGVWHFLPKLPKEFHSGRFIHLTTVSGDRIDMEWSKKELKKVVIYPQSNRIIHLKLQSSLHHYRLQKRVKMKHDQPLELQEGKTLYLDRFIH